MIIIRFEMANRALVFERTQRLSCSKTLKQAVDISAYSIFSQGGFRLVLLLLSWSLLSVMGFCSLLTSDQKKLDLCHVYISLILGLGVARIRDLDHRYLGDSFFFCYGRCRKQRAGLRKIVFLLLRQRGKQIRYEC